MFEQLPLVSSFLKTSPPKQNCPFVQVEWIMEHTHKKEPTLFSRGDTCPWICCDAQHCHIGCSQLSKHKRHLVLPTASDVAWKACSTPVDPVSGNHTQRNHLLPYKMLCGALKPCLSCLETASPGDRDCSLEQSPPLQLLQKVQRQ